MSGMDYPNVVSPEEKARKAHIEDINTPPATPSSVENAKQYQEKAAKFSADHPYLRPGGMKQTPSDSLNSAASKVSGAMKNFGSAWKMFNR